MKITPAIKQFIENNNSLSSRTLAALILEKFNVAVTYKAIEPHLKAARIEVEATNAAKVEAIRAKVLDDAGKWASKYLKYLDEEVESLKAIADAATETPIETAKDRATISMALQKGITSILDFVKPENDIEITVNQDLSKLSDEELKQLEVLAAKLEGYPEGESKTASP
jgi:hypothetical protein